MATRDNGHAPDAVDKSTANADARVRSKTKKTNPFRWALGVIVRLCIWYALLTPFFRCPSRISELNDSSPRVCKPYLVARSYIDPHVAPYYETYAAPYVDATRPYVNILNEKVYTPSINVAKHGYERYGAPALSQAQVYCQQQWDAQVTPRLQLVKDRANALYTSEVAPHVHRVETAVSPYYQRANLAIRSTAQDYILPFYARSMPFIGKTYTSGQDVLATTVLPYAQSTWSSAITFVSGSLWPKLTGLYSENVEPQLVKIGQRLASYREGKRLNSVVEETDSPTDQSTHSTPASSTETPKSEVPSTPSVVTTSSTPTKLSPAEIEAQTREKIASDLRTWEQKFAASAGNAVEELESRIAELVDEYVADEAKQNGEGLVTALQATMEQEISSVKTRINTLADSLPTEDAPEQEEEAQEALLKDVRESAITIRDRAHALREWHTSFDDELQRRVSVAARSALTVLDSIHNLGFQEIGTRWAWMDGVTYTDWEEYHSLKAQFDGWKNQFFHDRLKHPKLEEAKSVAEDILSTGMDAAEAAAKELGRLKAVGKWKITAREVSDNFDTRSELPPAPPKPTVVDEDNSTTEGEASGPDANVEQSDEESKASSHPTGTENTGSENSDVKFEDSPGPEHHETDANASLSDETEEVGFDTSLDDDETVLEEIHQDAGDDSGRPMWGAEAAAVPTVPPVQGMVDGELVDDASEVEESTQPSKIDDGEPFADPIRLSNDKTSSGTSDEKGSQEDSVREILNKLLAAKGSTLPDDLKLKLQAVYESPELMIPTSSVDSEESVRTHAQSTPASSTAIEGEKNADRESADAVTEDTPAKEDL
ncbi:hypothetical protein BDV59DRAFT_121373 [Aspergillus ambiguus]|uniref:uncharacterized protein n=1 Tax=Aspergillus ambiguus TaxID=176160 RepID=UPI003CCE4996